MGVTRFSTDALPPAARPEAFLAAMSARVCRLTPLEMPASFSARVEARQVGGRTLGRLAATSHDVQRSPRDIATDGREDLHVVMMLRGARRLRVHGHDRMLARGQIALVPGWRPFSLHGTGRTHGAVCLVLPTDSRLRQGVDRLLRLAAPLEGNPFARITAAACLALGQRVAEGSDTEIECLVSTAERLVHAMATGLAEAEPETADAMLARRIRHEIELFAGDPALDLDTLSARTGAPARRIQRVLAAQATSFSALLQRARMQRARSALAAGVRPIQAVAWDCGYAELSAFHRAFRRSFGCTPGECVVSAGAACRSTLP